MGIAETCQWNAKIRLWFTTGKSRSCGGEYIELSQPYRWIPEFAEHQASAKKGRAPKEARLDSFLLDFERESVHPEKSRCSGRLGRVGARGVAHCRPLSGSQIGGGLQGASAFPGNGQLTARQFGDKSCLCWSRGDYFHGGSHHEEVQNRIAGNDGCSQSGFATECQRLKYSGITGQGNPAVTSAALRLEGSEFLRGLIGLFCA